MNQKASRPSPVRLRSDDRAQVEKIQQLLGCESFAAALHEVIQAGVPVLEKSMTPAEILQELDSRETGAHVNNVHLIRALATNQRHMADDRDIRLTEAAVRVVTAMIEHGLVSEPPHVHKEIEAIKGTLTQ